MDETSAEDVDGVEGYYVEGGFVVGSGSEIENGLVGGEFASMVLGHWVLGGEFGGVDVVVDVVVLYSISIYLYIRNRG